ncbi:P-II family nitrogen regulator [Gorillibacterium timonense]|uniref:P-II family nitrogen regulator n=1 Tax=Gorillibacterium timonense TaxID=1689269 RepID=UPI000B25F17B|nr:P-II family nitrogen regulator [Gorillibacterium timonense]
MVRAIIRPQKVNEVISALLEAGFPSVTKTEVSGRGKQRGIEAGGIHYDEIAKVMLMIVVEDDDKDDLISIIMRNAKTQPKGHYGDGKIFVSRVDEAYTISTGTNNL